MSRTALVTVAVGVALAIVAVTGGSASGSAPTPAPAAASSELRSTGRHSVHAARVPLTRIYRGEDGGALYLRQLGSKVYGFGEHPGREYAFVLVGTVTGDRIDGSWWDVPKGQLRRVNRGTLELQWSQEGARIVRSGGADLGPDVFTAIAPDGIPWPNMEPAGFQATSTGDLDGVFVGDDGSRHYVRETSSNTVWVAERASQPGERPGWVTVFAGRRNAGGGVSGTYVDVPKGIELRSGSFGAAFVGSKRELLVEQQSVDRTRSLAPDYALDLDRFVTTVADSLENRVVGYAFAITYNGAIVRSHAWGFRQHAVDGAAFPFTPKTQAQTASAAKLVSATAVVKALRDRGLDVDTRVAPYLPSCIKKGPGVSSLTFRELLNHRNGLLGGRYGSRINSRLPESCNGRDPYECLIEVLAKGRVFQPLRYAYNNKAYDLLRFLVPLVVDTNATKADFVHFGCVNTNGVLNRRLAERFARYLRYEVLRPVGSDGTWYPSGNFSLNYNCEPDVQGAGCSPSRKGEAVTPEYFLRSGSGKMAMSVLDYVRFLAALERGLIVPKAVVESMKQGRLGFDTFVSGKAGPYFWKNGGCPSLQKPEWGRGCETLAIVFPGNVQAYLAINSANNTYSPDRQKLFRNAFDAALR
jgi:CubicO group peptidase (beta-lactamase class C family)